MKTFKEWLLKREAMEPFPAITTAQRAGLGFLTAMPTGRAKLPKWKRDEVKPKGEEQGKWRQ